MRFHVGAQDGVDTGLVSALAAEPSQQVGIKAHGDDFFRCGQDDFGGNVGTDGTFTGSTEIAYFAPVTGPMTKMVLPDGSSKSNVLAPHSSSFGGRKTSTFELHSR